MDIKPFKKPLGDGSYYYWTFVGENVKKYFEKDSPLLDYLSKNKNVWIVTIFLSNMHHVIDIYRDPYLPPLVSIH